MPDADKLGLWRSPYKRIVRHAASLEEQLELRIVDHLADQLLGHLVDVSDDIDRVHVHGARSSAVQEIVALLLRERLDFAEEWLIPPEDGFTTRARPTPLRYSDPVEASWPRSSEAGR